VGGREEGGRRERRRITANDDRCDQSLEHKQFGGMKMMKMKMRGGREEEKRR
jgi:hypothetical protein